MAGWEHSRRIRKNAGDDVNSGVSCPEDGCHLEFDYISSVKHHISSKHHMSAEQVETKMKVIKELGGEKLDVKKFYPVTGCSEKYSVVATFVYY